MVLVIDVRESLCCCGLRRDSVIAQTKRQNNETRILYAHFILIEQYSYTLHSRLLCKYNPNFETTQFRLVYYIIIFTVKSSPYCCPRNILHRSHCSLSTYTRTHLIPLSLLYQFSHTRKYTAIIHWRSLQKKIVHFTCRHLESKSQL